jgi:hypothetical protein
VTRYIWIDDNAMRDAVDEYVRKHYPNTVSAERPLAVALNPPRCNAQVAYSPTSAEAPNAI